MAGGNEVSTFGFATRCKKRRLDARLCKHDGEVVEASGKMHPSGTLDTTTGLGGGVRSVSARV
jgi:hypothetical protein